MSTKKRVLAKSAAVSRGSEQTIRVECSRESYTVVLDSNLMPLVVTLDSKSGLTSGTRIVYSDYTALNATHYPRGTEIKLPAGKQGIRVQLSELAAQSGPTK